MPRIQKRKTGVFTGPPDVNLVTRTVEFPAMLAEEPGRPVVISMPASSIHRMIRSLAALQAKFDGTSAQMASLDFFATDDD